MKCIVLKPSHIQGFLCNFKIERDISISLHKKWSWTPCMVGKNSPYCPIKDLQKKISNGLLMKWCSQSVYFLGPLGRDKWDARLTES